MLIRVYHADSNPSWDTPKDGSKTWFEYWKKYSRAYVPYKCPDCGKLFINNSDIVGAHVKKRFSSDNSVYIVPVCRECNSRGGSDNHSFECDDLLLVPANKDRIR